jgi:hypothetical protein
VGLGPFADVPVDPNSPEARDLLSDELAKQAYLSAKPTWWDQFLGGLGDWIQSLQVGNAQGPPAFGLVVLLIAVAVILLIAFLVFGLPRINRRSSVTGALFGEDDSRTAAQMRAAANSAASAGDYAAAIAEMFRSIARGLAERTVLSTSPGTTAHDFGARAGVIFPNYAAKLVVAASAFDEVRYLGRAGERAQFDDVAELERELRAAKARPAQGILEGARS